MTVRATELCFQLIHDVAAFRQDIQGYGDVHRCTVAHAAVVRDSASSLLAELIESHPRAYASGLERAHPPLGRPVGHHLHEYAVFVVEDAWATLGRLDRNSVEDIAAAAYELHSAMDLLRADPAVSTSASLSDSEPGTPSALGAASSAQFSDAAADGLPPADDDHARMLQPGLAAPEAPGRPPRFLQVGLLTGRAAEGFMRVQTWLAGGATSQALRRVALREKAVWCEAGTRLQRRAGIHALVDLLDHFALFNWNRGEEALQVLQRVAATVTNHPGDFEHGSVVLCLAALNQCNILRATAMARWTANDGFEATNLLRAAFGELQRALAELQANTTDALVREEVFNCLGFFSEADHAIWGHEQALHNAIFWFEEAAQAAISEGLRWVDEYSNATCHACRLQLQAAGDRPAEARKVEWRLRTMEDVAARMDAGPLTLRSRVNRQVELVRLYTKFPQLARARGISRYELVDSLEGLLESPGMLPRKKRSVVQTLGALGFRLAVSRTGP